MTNDEIMEGIGDRYHKENADFIALVNVRCEYHKEIDRIRDIFNNNKSYEGMLKIQHLTQQLKKVK